jgi:hypothetical protein
MNAAKLHDHQIQSDYTRFAIGNPFYLHSSFAQVNRSDKDNSLRSITENALLND